MMQKAPPLESGNTSKYIGQHAWYWRSEWLKYQGGLPCGNVLHLDEVSDDISLPGAQCRVRNNRVEVAASNNGLVPISLSDGLILAS